MPFFCNPSFLDLYFSGHNLIVLPQMDLIVIMDHTRNCCPKPKTSQICFMPSVNKKKVRTQWKINLRECAYSFWKSINWVIVRTMYLSSFILFKSGAGHLFFLEKKQIYWDTVTKSQYYLWFLSNFLCSMICLFIYEIEIRWFIGSIAGLVDLSILFSFKLRTGE